MTEIAHRFVETNGIRMHVAEAGSGPLVVLLHGFPESWYSWRNQLRALAEAGYHVVAPDQRGYGQTDRPDEVRAYTMLHLVGDVVGLLDALGEQQAVVVGHDWGAPVAWHTALLRPDRVRGVVGLSVPFRPRGPASPLSIMRARLGEGFYQAYFQQPGVADAELSRDVRATLRRLLYSASGDVPWTGESRQPVVPDGGGFLDLLVEPPALPEWLTEADLDFFTGEFERTGFTGGLNWYRNIDLGWELLAPWQGAIVTPPALYVAGDRDLVVNLPGVKERLADQKTSVPRLEPVVLLPGCGHWTQQERPAEVNAALLEFLGKTGGAVVAQPALTPDDQPAVPGRRHEDPAALDEILKGGSEHVRADVEPLSQLGRGPLEDGPEGQRPEDPALREQQAEGRLDGCGVRSAHAPDNDRATHDVTIDRPRLPPGEAAEAQGGERFECGA